MFEIQIKHGICWVKDSEFIFLQTARDREEILDFLYPELKHRTVLKVSSPTGREELIRF